MAQSHASLLGHLIFSTKERRQFLAPAIREELFKYLAGIANGESLVAHAIGGIEDHIHLLISLPRTKTVASVVETLKTSSSKWLKTKGGNLQLFSWQGGYGAFSVSHSQMVAVCNYIRNQEEHHRRFNYQDEIRAILKKHDIGFNEQYLWA